MSIGGKKFAVVGLRRPPLGGQASDVYVELGELQAVSDREGRVNGMNVRATDSGSVTRMVGQGDRASPPRRRR